MSEPEIAAALQRANTSYATQMRCRQAVAPSFDDVHQERNRAGPKRLKLRARHEKAGSALAGGLPSQKGSIGLQSQPQTSLRDILLKKTREASRRNIQRHIKNRKRAGNEGVQARTIPHVEVPGSGMEYEPSQSWLFVEAAEHEHLVVDGGQGLLQKKIHKSMRNHSKLWGRRVGTSMGTDKIFQNAQRLNLFHQSGARGHLNIGQSGQFESQLGHKLQSAATLGRAGWPRKGKETEQGARPTSERSRPDFSKWSSLRVRDHRVPPFLSITPALSFKGGEQSRGAAKVAKIAPTGEENYLDNSVPYRSRTTGTRRTRDPARTFHRSPESSATKVKHSKDLSSAKQEVSLSIDEGNFFLRSSLGDNEERDLDPLLRTRLIASQQTDSQLTSWLGRFAKGKHNSITRNLRAVEQTPAVAVDVDLKEGVRTKQASSPYTMALQTVDSNKQRAADKLTLRADSDYDMSRALTPVLNPSFYSPHTPLGPKSFAVGTHPDIEELEEDAGNPASTSARQHGAGAKPGAEDHLTTLTSGEKMASVGYHGQHQQQATGVDQAAVQLAENLKLSQYCLISQASHRPSTREEP